MAKTSITAWVKKTKRDMVDVVNDSFVELGADIVSATPIDTGHAAGQWDYSIDKSRLKWELSNNTEYILPLEYGHSAQAPHGMVRTNTPRWDSIVNRNAKSS